jgi:hypothetical protein
MVVWDCGTIVNQRGRAPRIGGDAKPCFSCHSGAISARRRGQSGGRQSIDLEIG